MTALASTTSIRVTAPTMVERFLLRVARRLERVAVVRMTRRAARGHVRSVRGEVLERQRDLGAAVHAGLLPR